MKKFIIYIYGFLLFCSCQKKVHFNDFEKSLLEIYNVGDTLIFESDKGKRDTSYILSKDIGYADWNPFAYGGDYKVLIGTIYYGSSKKLIKGDMYPYKILNIGKSHPDSSYLSILYNGIHASWNFDRLSPMSWESYKVGDNLYKFEVSKKEKGLIAESLLFFHLNYGVIKYVTSEGEVWRRVNIK